MSRLNIIAMLCGLAVVMAGCVVQSHAYTCGQIPTTSTWTADPHWLHDSSGTVGYSLWLPKNYVTTTKYPVFVFLHAAGGHYWTGGAYINLREQDVNFLTCDSIQTKYPCIIYAPQTPSDPLKAPHLWVNLPATPGHPAAPGYWDHGTYSVNSVPISPPMRDAMSGLDSVIKKYSVDTNRIYVGGGSMGGYGTWDAVCRNPGKFACAVAVGGGADTSKARNLKNLAVYAFALTSDRTINVKWNQQMVAALQAAGGSPRSKWYTESQVYNKGYTAANFAYPHIWVMPFVLEPDLIGWVHAQSKSLTETRPDEVAAASVAPVSHARSIVNLARTRAVSIRFYNERQGVAREFDTQGRPVRGRLTGR